MICRENIWTLGMFCKIVLGSQFQKFNLKSCFIACRKFVFKKTQFWSLCQWGNSSLIFLKAKNDEKLKMKG